ncbi:hypothetical protein BDA96_04G199100 [Sorghum bicolor]|uniref:PHD-type zinc finger plants domain-containing protein n=2 Tax=Sorghum bicolor TaxID=4558 RepID=A0A921R5A2_SORBI|nr:uncharacterized protein LOC8072613 [Sorghum bicolor]KAG0533509.1 hypothetical protein BDA96_04G199100 [Sorghum bicolor]OQU85183.1 hypothetical protein SORBI_3004G187501 [Sorghum bicolor]|eukprot:XP_021316225.1 uncharacterized protein LOC8072613 [Sorghum bicolor]
MVSPGAAAAAAAAVCCMCGDQGLPDELFQCAVCLQRLQHRYCSDQYPRMAAYSTCNWCLGDKQVGEGSPSPSPAAAKALTTARAKQRAAASRLNGSRGHHGDKLGCTDTGYGYGDTDTAIR